MSPNTWLSVLVVVFWLVLGIAAKAAKSTISLSPVIPLIPAILWLAGILVNHFGSPWGTIIITAIHALLLACMLLLFARWRREEKDRRGRL